MRRITLIIALLAVTVVSLPATAQAERLDCKSADLRYPFSPGGPETFGVFRLKIGGGDCATAHDVAAEWMKRFEANLSDGKVKLPRDVDGYKFTTLATTQSQTYRERGRKDGSTIRFDYRVPNG